jgi:hypothetical protein
MHTYRARNTRLTRVAAEHDAEELRVLLCTRAEGVHALAAGEFGTLAGAGAMALALETYNSKPTLQPEAA